MMNYADWSKKAMVLAVLVAARLGTVPQVQAQNDNKPNTNNSSQLKEQAKVLLDLDGSVGRVKQHQYSPLVLDTPAEAQAPYLNQLLFTVRDPADELLGATLQPIDDTMRAQLDIPAGQGLLVSALRGDGPSAQVGLKPNDILLTLGGQPLAAAEDVRKQLKAAGESAVPLKILRAGKPLTIQVRPIYRVTLGPVVEAKAEYFIGVNIDAVDDAIRAQLALPEGQGVVVNDVISGSPADKAGVKKHDILLEIGGKRIDNPQDLAREVQLAQDKPTTLKLLRGGKPLTLPVTGSLRPVEPSAAQEDYRVWLLERQLGQAALKDNLSRSLITLRDLKRADSAVGSGEDLGQRLDHVEQELKALRAAIDKVNEALRTNKPAKPD
ncbi:MAG TPA: PDZ domain-containing protein [Gemmataceae bacterium]|nr:PDZ domain-containing protein [Gemmataceae bacterium]